MVARPLLLVPLLASCSTWHYAVQSSPAEVRVEPALEIRAVQRADGQLEIVNRGPKRIYLVWDHLGAILPDGVQRRVYKGRQTRVNAEASIPPQPIEPGATLRESYVLTELPLMEVLLPRPATAIDYALCWIYGLGCLLADLSWQPDDAYKRQRFGALVDDGAPLYELLVPILPEGEPEQLVRLKLIGRGVTATKR